MLIITSVYWIHSLFVPKSMLTKDDYDIASAPWGFTV